MSSENSPAEKFLAVDIGGSKLLTALVSRGASGEPCLTGVARRALARDCGQAGVLSAIESAVDETLRTTNSTVDSFWGIGATIPGLADPEKGMWVYAPFSGIGDFAIAKILRERYGKPVAVENDVNACAWAEKIFGACQDADNFLWITVSNGIGGGLVLDGKVYPGPFAGAAEIGHVKIVENGALCGCGGRGCLEAEAAGPAIARRFAQRYSDNSNGSAGADSAAVRIIMDYKKSKGLPQDAPLDAKQIAELARAGVTLAKEVYDTSGYYIGRAAAMAANIINPEKIVIGGGVAGAFDLLEPEMTRVFNDQLFKTVNRSLKIVKTALGYEAGLYAAASLLCDARGAFRHDLR